MAIFGDIESLLIHLFKEKFRFTISLFSRLVPL